MKKKNRVKYLLKYFSKERMAREIAYLEYLVKKYCRLIILLLSPLFVDATTYYVSTTGNDANAGTIGSPFLTLEHLNGLLSAGDIAYVRGGTYRVSKSASTTPRIGLSGFTGSSGNTIKIWAYPGETPVFNFDDVLCTGGGVIGFSLSGSSYVHIKGLQFTGLYQNPSTPNSIWNFHISSSPNCTIEQCEVGNSSMYGFTNYNSDNTLWLNCDAHHLTDPYTTPVNGGSTGFVSGQNGNTSTNVTYRGCRAWNIADNGFMYFRLSAPSDGTITYDSCWSFWNGYSDNGSTPVPSGDDAGNGFKLGLTATDASTTHLFTLTNCLAIRNNVFGFNQNNARAITWLYNNMSYRNVNTGFKFGYFVTTSIFNILKNNIAYLDSGVLYAGQTNNVTTNNTWDGGVTVTGADFVSLDETQLDNTRQSDGSLPVITAFHLASGSDLIDAGTNVGLPFNNAAPDMGAFETGGSTPPVLNTIKVVRRPKRIE